MKNLPIALVLLTPFFAQAQLQFGVTTSYNTALSNSVEYLAPLNGQYAYSVNFDGHKNTKTIGFAVKSTFDNIFASVELTYRKTEYHLIIDDFSEGSIMPIGVSRFAETSSVFHIPVSAGIEVGSLTFALGPYFNYNQESENPTEEYTDILDKERKLSSGFHVIIGYNITHNVGVFIRYEKAFADVGGAHYFNGKKLKLCNRLNYLSLGGNVYL